MPRISVFVFEIDSKNDLEREVKDTFKKMKVDTSLDLPWEGFLTKKDSDALAHEKDNLGADRFTYVIEEEENYTSIDGKTYNNRKQYNLSVWVDVSSKILMIFTSDAGKAFKIIHKIASADDNNLTITPLKLEVDFLKWMETIKDYQKSKLTEIIGTRATNLSAVDGITNSLSLTTTDILNKSQVFTHIKDKGNRVYLKGMFKINDFEIESSFYTNCKISLSKKKASDMTMDEAKHSAKTIYQELKKWHNKWKSQ